MNEAQMTLVGNLVEDPEMRFTPAGQPAAKFRIASTPRFRDNATGEWKDGDSLFLTCTAWRQAAENIAESLTRGARVIVTGRLKQRSYETKEGEKRTVYELEVDEIGPSLRNATAKVRRSPGATGEPGQQARRKDADPWAGPVRRLLRRAAVLSTDAECPPKQPCRGRYFRAYGNPPGPCGVRHNSAVSGPRPRRARNRRASTTADQAKASVTARCYPTHGRYIVPSPEGAPRFIGIVFGVAFLWGVVASSPSVDGQRSALFSGTPPVPCFVLRRQTGSIKELPDHGATVNSDPVDASMCRSMSYHQVDIRVA